MKQMRLLFITCFIFLSLASQAQLFVGGSLGLSSSGGTTKSGSNSQDLDSDLNFQLSPAIGYFLSEKMCAGAMVTFMSTKSVDVSLDITDYSTSYGITPFARYYPLKVNKFSVFMQGAVYFLLSNSKVKDAGVTTDGPKGTTFGFALSPGLEYDLTENISLETGINFLSLGYFMHTSKQTIANVDYSTTNNNFTFGAGLDNILSVNAISIGAIYRF